MDRVQQLGEKIWDKANNICNKLLPIIVQEFNMQTDIDNKSIQYKKADMDEAMIYIETMQIVMAKLLFNILITNHSIEGPHTKQQILKSVDFIAGVIINEFNNKLWEEINAKEKFATEDETLRKQGD